MVDFSQAFLAQSWTSFGPAILSIQTMFSHLNRCLPIYMMSLILKWTDIGSFHDFWAQKLAKWVNLISGIHYIGKIVEGNLSKFGDNWQQDLGWKEVVLYFHEWVMVCAFLGCRLRTKPDTGNSQRVCANCGGCVGRKEDATYCCK